MAQINREFTRAGLQSVLGHGRVALGPRAGQPLRRLRSAAAATAARPRCARLEGFSLHADVGRAGAPPPHPGSFDQLEWRQLTGGRATQPHPLTTHFHHDTRGQYHDTRQVMTVTNTIIVEWRESDFRGLQASAKEGDGGRAMLNRRNSRLRGLLLRGAAVTLIAIALSLGWIAGRVEANHVIKIGVAGPLTGSDAKWGQEVVNAATIALEERSGMVAGHKIEFLLGDDKADPKEAVAVAHKFVNAGTFAVLGHVNSHCTIPASIVYNEAGVIEITPDSSAQEVTERGFKMLYRIITRHDQQAVFVANYLIDVAKAKRVAIIHDKTNPGQGLADSLRLQLEKRGLKPVFFEAIVRGEKDFTPVVTKLKPLKPDYTYFTGNFPEGGLLVKQFRDVGVPGVFSGGDGNQDPVFIETGGKAAEGALISTAPLPEQLSSAAGFFKKYTAKYGQGGPFIHYNYDAAAILFAAMEKVGSKLADNAKAVNAELRRTRFDGASGTITFDEKGDVVGRAKQFIVLQVKNGKFEPYYAPKGL